jgi:hypothetical protein
MSDSDDPLEAARKAKEAAEAKKRAEAAQEAAEINGMLQKWGDDLAAALDAAAATIPSLEGSSNHKVAIEANEAALSYRRRGTSFELRAKARAICQSTSTSLVKGQLIISGDEPGEQMNTWLLEATLQPNDRGPEMGYYSYGLQPLGGSVSVDPVGFAMFLKTLAG